MKRDWKISGILIGILILAAFLRLYQLPTFPPGLYPDEAMNGSNALEALYGTGPTSGMHVFYPENNGREGLFINIQAVFLAALAGSTGNVEPWMLRIPSTLFGLLTVLGIFFLTRELLRADSVSEKTATHIALLSAFLIATSFWHINFSRIGFRAIAAPAFLTWAIYFLLVILRRGIDRREWMLPLLAGIVYGLGFHTYIAYRATLLVIAAVALWFLVRGYPWRQWIRIAWIYTLGLSLAVAPLLAYFWRHPQDFFGRTSEISVFSSVTPIWDLALNILKTIGMFFVSGDQNWRHNIAGAPELFWPIACFFLLGICLGIRSLVRAARTRSPSSLFFLTTLGWLIVASAPVVISNESIPHALRSILMIPPVFVIAGWGGITLYSSLRLRIHTPTPRWLLPALSACILTTIAYTGYRSYFIQWGPRAETADAFSQNSVLIAHTLNTLPQELPKYVVVPPGSVNVRGVSVSAQTVMFLTRTFLPEWQRQKNIFYILPGQESTLSSESYHVYLP